MGKGAETNSPPPARGRVREGGGPESGPLKAPLRLEFPRTRDSAKALRRSPTDAEKRLWSHLRRRRLDGHRFRRQAPIGPFVADFACMSARLIVELDGGQHGRQAGREANRDRWLAARGYRVVRSGNHDVMSNAEGVLEEIRTALREAAR